jgi:hypothetical protein
VQSERSKTKKKIKKYDGKRSLYTCVIERDSTCYRGRSPGLDTYIDLEILRFDVDASSMANSEEFSDIGPSGLVAGRGRPSNNGQGTSTMNIHVYNIRRCGRARRGTVGGQRGTGLATFLKDTTGSWKPTEQQDPCGPNDRHR